MIKNLKNTGFLFIYRINTCIGTGSNMGLHYIQDNNYLQGHPSPDLFGTYINLFIFFNTGINNTCTVYMTYYMYVGTTIHTYIVVVLCTVNVPYMYMYTGNTGNDT